MTKNFLAKGNMLFFIFTCIVTSYLLVRGIVNLFINPITGITMLILAVLIVFSTTKM